MITTTRKNNFLSDLWSRKDNCLIRHNKPYFCIIMPQTFQVLRCYKCEVFQVHPTKKANKWKCKLCNEKQSIKRFYGLGTGKECRLHVQKLNGIRADIDAAHCESDTSEPGNNSEESGQNEISSCSVTKKSKWLEYVDTAERQQVPDEPMLPNNTKIVLELPIKHPRKSYSASTKIMSKPKTEDLSENYSQPSTFSNNCTRANVIKSIDGKTDTNSCMVNAATNVPVNLIVDNSKWAKFVEDTQNCKGENILDPISCTDSLSALNPPFQFLEEEDLDSVLDL